MAYTRSAPEVRGKYMRDFVAGLDTLLPAEKDAVLALVDPETRRRIDDSGPLEWLPFEVNLELTHAVMSALSPDRAEHFFRVLLKEVLDSSVLASFVDGTLRLFTGKGPRGAVKRIPIGFNLVFRGLGEWGESPADAQRHHVHATNLPNAVTARWLQSVVWSFTSVLDKVNAAGGEVRLIESKPDEGRVRYELRWT